MLDVSHDTLDLVKSGASSRLSVPSVNDISSLNNGDSERLNGSRLMYKGAEEANKWST
jgi:hypothetical protein